MSINPADLERIDQQIKVQKGVLPMRYEVDNGDENPPEIDKAITGMGNPENTENGQNGGAIDVAVALKGFWKFVDMMISMICSRVDAIEYKNLSDAELTNISQQTAQVEIFQKLAVAENAPMWLSVANLIGTFGTKFQLSDEWKAKQKQKKIDEEIAKRNAARNALSPVAQEVLAKAQEKLKVPRQEPVYDGTPEDTSEAIEILDESERRIKEQLAAASEVTNEDMKMMKISRRAAAIKRTFEEKEMKKRNANSGLVGVLDE